MQKQKILKQKKKEDNRMKKSIGTKVIVMIAALLAVFYVQ